MAEDKRKTANGTAWHSLGIKEDLLRAIRAAEGKLKYYALVEQAWRLREILAAAVPAEIRDDTAAMVAWVEGMVRPVSEAEEFYRAFRVLRSSESNYARFVVETVDALLSERGLPRDVEK